MDPELDYVAPVRIATRRCAPIALTDVVAEGFEAPEPFYAITFDNGGTSGWSLFGVWPEAMHDPRTRILDSIAFWSAGQFTGTEGQQVDQMMGLIEAWPDETRILCEDFILQQFSMARDLLAPVRINARLEDRLYVVSGGERYITYQQPSLAMRTITDEMLKTWGFWNVLKGQQHARDAVKHNITWLRRLKQQFIDEDRAEAEPVG